MFDDLRDLYQEVILDHGRHPRHGHRLAAFDASARGDNPMCGDRVQVFVKYAPGRRHRRDRVRSARLRHQHRLGRSDGGDGDRPQPDQVRAMSDAFRDLARTGTCPHCDAALKEPMERLEPLAGVHEYPSRVKCATLPWHALIAALDGAQETSSE